MLELVRHPYKYFPYELALAGREARALFPGASWQETAHGLALGDGFDPGAADRLVYFAGALQGGEYAPTLQARLECAGKERQGRQATRYSAHGLHEYKGKFNPQIVRAMLNILDVPASARVLDPFCGSGTALLECAHLGMAAVGMDINPLAVFVANAKLAALGLPAAELRRHLREALKREPAAKRPQEAGDPAREDYLLSWFTPEIYADMERLRCAIEALGEPASAPLLAIASNLLRDYSLQDPNDLRTRRRKTPLPRQPFAAAWEAAAERFLGRLEDAQRVLGLPDASSWAALADSRTATAQELGVHFKFDCALTSPPYASALPYIDTQRLSLVWLGLVPPAGILPLESSLVGSRELRGGKLKRQLLAQLAGNDADLPAAQAEYCRMLQGALGDGDGFRRQAAPLLLYRYFVCMAQAFSSLRALVKPGAPFALIVGGNHTVLGGRRFDIDTPRHLAALAGACGWAEVETIPLQAYQRYGYHMLNAVTTEAMLVLRAA